MADWENRSSKGYGRGTSGGISPSEERRLKTEGRRASAEPYTRAYPASPGIAPQVTNQFSDLIADPRTGQLREMAQGPYAGPVISPEQWMSQHPMMQLGNLFARMLAASPFAIRGQDYSDPYHAPIGASWR